MQKTSILLQEYCKIIILLQEYCKIIILLQEYLRLASYFATILTSVFFQRAVRENGVLHNAIVSRYLSLIFSIICSIFSEVCYVLRGSIFGQVGWFISGILLHRCYEFTLPAVQSADLTVLSKQLCAEERTAKAYKTMFLKMVSLFLVLLFYVFIVGMAVASQDCFCILSPKFIEIKDLANMYLNSAYLSAVYLFH